MINNLILLILMIMFSTYAIFSPRLLFAAIALGLSSCLLAIIFFDLGAPFAGGFELSIGAGLISMLFIMAISLTERKQQ
jgi:NADH-quinone oxidoreductase subunit J